MSSQEDGLDGLDIDFNRQEEEFKYANMLMRFIHLHM